MSWQYVEKDWDRLETQVRREWNAMTSEDLAGIDGNLDRLVSRIAERYELSREEAQRQVNEWAARMERDQA